MQDDHISSTFDAWIRDRSLTHRPRGGLSFWDLGCDGYASDALYQPTFISYLLDVPKFVMDFVNRHDRRRTKIIQNVTGLIKPGEMLLVLGRPGSGCSTLLKALAGDTHGFRIKDKKKLNYGGCTYEKMSKEMKGERIYLAELDIHFAELTVGETLRFAASIKTSKQSPGSSPHIDQSVTSLFYLDRAADTKIGNDLIRGVSGGEKRRTSLAEAFLSDSQFQFWDNSTRGLDSSTALRFVRLLRKSTDALQLSVAMSIYQASENMYKSFDKVILLYEGHQIYFGPVDQAPRYFIKMGFIRPPRATTADFLTSLTSPQERMVRPGYENSVPRSPEEFSLRWQGSVEASVLQCEIEALWRLPRNTMVDGKRRTLRPSSYIPSLLEQVIICAKRGFLRIQNNLAASIAPGLFGAIISIVLGTLFYQLGESTSEMDKRAVVLFIASMHTATTPGADIPAMWAQRPIVEKHERYAWYYPVSEMMAALVAIFPQKFFDCLFFLVPLYFMADLRREAGAFFTYWLFMFVTHLVMTMLFRTVGSLTYRPEQTVVPVSVLALLSIIYTGYAVPIPYMPSWIGWIRWLNPVSYSYESVLINEFRDRQFLCTDLVPSGESYETLDASMRTCTKVGAVPGEEFVKGSNYLLLKFGYHANHLWRNLGILLAMLAVLTLLHLIVANYVRGARSRGEVLVFKRRHRNNGPYAHGDGETGSEVILLQNMGYGNSRMSDVDLNQSIDHGIWPATQAVWNHIPSTTKAVQKQSATICWSDLGYGIKTKTGVQQILKNIDGWVKPGSLTVLMGTTGAGKTTLLDVLADRVKNGIVTGKVSVEGHARDASFGRRIGYVQQEDIHLATATVREALEFSAMLRQPEKEATVQMVQRYVDLVLKMLELEPYADAIVGIPGEGLNVEQRRRLTIAVEIAAKPDILFLDEPTSGLDSQTAWAICMLLRKLASNGQTVLCTLHQPSSQLFELFDNLLLLGSGGEQLYFGEIGPGASTVIDYFESYGIDKCPPGANPAEWIVEATRNTRQLTDNDDQPSFAAQMWNHSTQKAAVHKHLFYLQSSARSQTSAAGSGTALPMPSPFAASFLRQLDILLKRNFRDYWRDPMALYTKLLLCIGMSLANGLSFVNSPMDIQGITNLIFSILLVVVLFVTLDQLIIPRLISQRNLFESRESRNKSYSWVIFVLTNTIVELVWQTIAGIMFFICWYFPTGMWRNGNDELSRSERGGLSFVLIWFFLLFTSTLSQAVSIAAPLADTGIQLASLLYWFMIMFCGVLIFPSSIPRFWVFVYRANPFTYLVNGLLIVGLGKSQVKCSSVEQQSIGLAGIGESCGEYLFAFVKANGGYIVNPNETSGPCLYCPIGSTDDFFSKLGLDMGSGGAYVGYSAVYIIFNILFTFGIYYTARVR